MTPPPSPLLPLSQTSPLKDAGIRFLSLAANAFFCSASFLHPRVSPPPRDSCTDRRELPAHSQFVPRSSTLSVPSYVPAPSFPCDFQVYREGCVSAIGGRQLLIFLFIVLTALCPAVRSLSGPPIAFFRIFGVSP